MAELLFAALEGLRRDKSFGLLELSTWPWRRWCAGAGWTAWLTTAGTAPVTALRVAARTFRAAFATGHAIGMNLLPLLGCKHLAEAEQHAGVGFFEIGAGLGDAVNLLHDLAFVGLIFAHQRLEAQLGFFERGVQIYEGEPVLLKALVHGLALGVGELVLLDDAGLVPPAAMIAVRAHGALHGRTVRAETGATVTGSLCKACAGREERRRQSESQMHSCDLHVFLIPQRRCDAWRLFSESVVFTVCPACVFCFPALRAA
jgi:hypothetical protein